MGYFDSLALISNPQRRFFTREDSETHWYMECPGGDSATMMAIATGEVPKPYNSRRYNDKAAWLMCVACGSGAFAIGRPDQVRVAFPEPEPFGIPENLSDKLTHAWTEALKSFSSGAFTGSTLMCEKIISHVAVDVGLSEKDTNGFPHTFEQSISYLVEEGYITTRQKNGWVDSIHKWGNTAAHDLAVINKETAHCALAFTYLLLQMVYAAPNHIPESA